MKFKPRACGFATCKKCSEDCSWFKLAHERQAQLEEFKEILGE